MPFDFQLQAKATNKEFAEELARLTTLTTKDVERLFPRKIDKQRFEQLMQIVNASANRNKRIAALENNFKAFSMSVMRLLETFT
ncbi:MAG: hypothetical protein QNJ07_13205 [Woeseiaceae bacterium]|nr:hypothetical protein [Woeseiaceae bacterium]